MEVEMLLTAAIQSSFMLGLIHGVNPCGHSWLVLAPFISAEKSGRKVTVLTASFLTGTALACLILGASLGAVSMLIPPAAGVWVEGGTSLILLVIGLLLLYDPHILHSHGHHHDDHHHNDGNSCNHSHDEMKVRLSDKLASLLKNQKSMPIMLFGIGFINMIVPCPTAAVMYGYALNSGSTSSATLVFGTYALSTAIAVGAVIYMIFKVTSMASSLKKDWVEPLVMRLAGLVIVVFSVYGLFTVMH
ncbi:MAG: sulfite exporter TauE/SafE family protein [Desulfobacterales bacterium]|nr:sulfite exporter TauE/SafE family protein [Desulfofustis sp.]NNK95360.1 sulfite exporter TauE/SafE family protein [Desulfobacterales bacterium]